MFKPTYTNIGKFYGFTYQTMSKWEIKAPILYRLMREYFMNNPKEVEAKLKDMK